MTTGFTNGLMQCNCATRSVPRRCKSTIRLPQPRHVTPRFCLSPHSHSSGSSCGGSSLIKSSMRKMVSAASVANCRTDRHST